MRTCVCMPNHVKLVYMPGIFFIVLCCEINKFYLFFVFVYVLFV